MTPDPDNYGLGPRESRILVKRHPAEYWTRENLAWCAGIFEGEGYIGIKSRTRKNGALSKSPEMVVGMTDKDVVDRLGYLMGLGRITGPFPSVYRTKPIWKWQVSRLEDAQAVIAAFYPWLGHRRRARAIDVLTEARNHPQNRHLARRGSGNDLACRVGHPRGDGNAYRRQLDGSWVCRVCRRQHETTRKRARRGEGAI